jgi:hypothetical protein
VGKSHAPRSESRPPEGTHPCREGATLRRRRRAPPSWTGRAWQRPDGDTATSRMGHGANERYAAPSPKFRLRQRPTPPFTALRISVSLLVRRGERICSCPPPALRRERVSRSYWAVYTPQAGNAEQGEDKVIVMNSCPLTAPAEISNGHGRSVVRSAGSDPFLSGSNLNSPATSRHSR